MNDLIEIIENNEPGYMPIVAYDAWRVAFVNHDDSLKRENIHRLHKHLLTDEVFVLLCGKATIFIADGKEKPTQMYPMDMKPNTIYNIKKSTWHGIATTPETKVLIVENDDTSSENTKYSEIDL